MKGDFTRLAFKPDKHFRGVLMQQGRVQLESDWNEQVQIAEHRYSTFFGDFVGQSGAPANIGMLLWQDSGLNLGATTSIRAGDFPPVLQNATLEMWLCVDSAPAGVIRCIVDLDDGMGFGVQDGFPCIKLGANTSWIKCEQAKKVDDKHWHHLTWSFDKVRGGGLPPTFTLKLKIQIDGQGVSDTSLGGGVGAVFSHITIGAWGQLGQESLYSGGKVSELRVWNITSENTPSPTDHLDGTEPNLIRYYRFDDADHAASAVDRSPSKKDAAIHGDVTRCNGPFQTGPISLRKGRYYVDGLLIENETSFDLDKDYLDKYLPSLSGGLNLVYLDVWTSHVTAVEDQDLIEPALGGADTTTRLKTAWRLRSVQLAEVDAEAAKLRYCPSWPKPENAIHSWEQPLSTGELQIVAVSVNADVNCLYRVEIHKEGKPGEATFKWSRNNGTTVAPVKAVDFKNKKIILDQPTKAITDAFDGTEFVEISDQMRFEKGEPGVIAQLSKSSNDEEGCLIIDKWIPTPIRPFVFGHGITVRRWDSTPLEIPAILTVGSDVTISGPIKLGTDLNVTFSKDSNAFYRSGDYWLIPVRTGGMILDWEKDKNDALLPRQPDGVLHHFAALALIKKDGATLALVDNLQTTFQPLTEGNVSKGGDAINGDLCVRGRLSVGDNIFRAPLTITAAQQDGALAVFRDQSGNDAWHIKHSATADSKPTLTITDGNENGLFIQQSGKVGIGTAQGGYSSIQSIKASGSAYGDLILNEHGGLVGIGTSAPGSTLTVNGTLSVNGYVGIGTKTSSVILEVNGNLNVGMGDETTDNGRIWVAIGQDGAAMKIQGHAQWVDEREGHAFDDPSNLALQVEGGNVGIGTPTPQGALHVVVDEKKSFVINGKIPGYDKFDRPDDPNAPHFRDFFDHIPNNSLVWGGVSGVSRSYTLYLYWKDDEKGLHIFKLDEYVEPT